MKKKEKYPPQEGQKKIFGAFGADPFPQNLNLEKDGFENFEGVWRGGGSGIRTGRPAWTKLQYSGRNKVDYVVDFNLLVSKTVQ